MSEPVLMPAFHKRKKNALSIARLVTGYGEIEFLLAWCAGTALACQTPIPPGTAKGEHRQSFEHEGIVKLFSIRGESKRVDLGKKIISPTVINSTLEQDYKDAIDAIWACLAIRNGFAHCNWDQSPKLGLFFVNLEETAKRTPFRMETQHADTASLKVAEDYFAHTMALLNYLAQAMAVTNGVAIGPLFPKPVRIPVLKTGTDLFPHKQVR
jgi:hypothetical protein